MQIYLARNNVQAGPYTLEQVNNMLASGEVILTDLAWHENMPQWQPLGELTGGQYVYNPNGIATSNEKKAEEISENKVETPSEDKPKEVAKIVLIDARGVTEKKKQEKRLTVIQIQNNPLLKFMYLMLISN